MGEVNNQSGDIIDQTAPGTFSPKPTLSQPPLGIYRVKVNSTAGLQGILQHVNPKVGSSRRE